MGLRVLIVEDEFMIASMLEHHLMCLGYADAPIAASVAEALSLLEQLEIHLAIVDINLAGTASFPVADALKARGIPFVFTTGYGESGVPEQYRDSPIVQKPYRIAKLAPVLRELLPGAEAGTAAAGPGGHPATRLPYHPEGSRAGDDQGRRPFPARRRDVPAAEAARLSLPSACTLHPLNAGPPATAITIRGNQRTTTQ